MYINSYIYIMLEVCVAKRNGKISAIGRQRVNIYSESGTKRRKHLPLFSFSHSRILYKLLVTSQKFSFGRFQKKKEKKRIKIAQPRLE